MRDPPSVSPLRRRQVTATFYSQQGRRHKVPQEGEGTLRAWGTKTMHLIGSWPLLKVATGLSEVIGQVDGVARARASAPGRRPHNSL